MLLLAGLHLLHLHVPVITTHLRTALAGAGQWWGGQRGPWMLLLVIAPVSPSPTSLSPCPRRHWPECRQAVAGSAASAPISSSRDIMEPQQHHCNNTATAKLKLFSQAHFVIELSEHKPYKLSFSCAVFQCRISTQTRQMPVSVSVSVWMRVSARQIPLDPPPLVSSPNADPPIILAKCSTYTLMPGPIVLGCNRLDQGQNLGFKAQDEQLQLYFWCPLYKTCLMT